MEMTVVQPRIGDGDTVGMMVRMPAPLRDRIKASARINSRSMNSEIVTVLGEHYANTLYRLSPEGLALLEAGESPLKVWLIERQWTPVDLSNATGLRMSAITKMMQGRYGSLATMQKIADALGITVDDLLYNPDL